MRLRIVESNFTIKLDWLFRLADERGTECFIMNESYYKSHDLESPITKKELDSYEVGLWISASIKEIDGKRVVIKGVVFRSFLREYELILTLDSL